MVEQGSKEWLVSRIGKFTGSRISELMSSGKKKDDIFGKVAMAYIYEVASERSLLPSYLKDDYLFEIYQQMVTTETKYTRFGHENEDLAVDKYQDSTGYAIEYVESVNHPTIPNFSASPDRIAITQESVRKVVEVKCPTPKTYMLYKAEIKDNETLKSVKPEYFYQIQAELAVTGLQEADFVVFCPFLRNGIHIVSITRDESVQESFAFRIPEANKIIDNILNNE